ncbi:hypothetical protein D3C76_942220 [compost metagenome]
MREAVGHKADSGHQRTGEHRRGRMTPGVRGSFDAVVALFHFHHHHFDSNDGVVHQQSKRQNQRAKGNTVKVLSGGRHHHKHHGQRQRHSRSDHNTNTPAHAEKADKHYHKQRDEELDHKLADGRIDIYRLIGDFGERHTQRHAFIYFDCLRVQRLAKVKTVPALTHHDPQQQGLFTVVTHEKGCWIFITTFDRRHVREF